MLVNLSLASQEPTYRITLCSTLHPLPAPPGYSITTELICERLLLPIPHTPGTPGAPTLCVDWVPRIRALSLRLHRKHCHTPSHRGPSQHHHLSLSALGSLGTHRNTHPCAAPTTPLHHVPALTTDAWRTWTTPLYRHLSDVGLHTPPERPASHTNKDIAMELPQQPNLRVTSKQEHEYQYARRGRG